MKIIKTDQGQFIKQSVDCIYPDDKNNRFWTWGYRWHKNEGRWEKLNKSHFFDNWSEVTEADLPKRLPEVEV